MGYFKFLEEISTTAKTKKIEPLISATEKEGENAKYEISNYFYNLNSDDIKELDKIFDYSQKVSLEKNKETINKDSWLKYMVQNNIKITLSKSIKKSSIISNDDNSVSVMYGKNGKFKKLSFDDTNLYSKEKEGNKPLFKIEKNDVPTDNINKLFLLCEGIYKNDKDLLYMLLDCIFSSNDDYYIKKCDLCQRYYFTKRKNTHYCNRKRIVCGKETTCFDSLDFLCEQKEYRYIRDAIKKHLDKYYKKYDYNYINKFKVESDPIMEKCVKKRDVTREDIDYIDNLISKS